MTDNYRYIMKVYKDSEEWVVSIDELSNPDVFTIEIEAPLKDTYHLIYSVYTRRIFHNKEYNRCGRRFHISIIEQIEDICRYLDSPL